jgi:pimeloyl-ACP methyl ester carboxylesterase
VAAYDLAELSQDLLAVIAAMDAGPVHVVGHSFGGLSARAAAIEDPTAFLTLTLLCSGPGPIGGAEAVRARQLEAALQQYDLPDIWVVIGSLAEANGEYDGVPPAIRAFLRRRFLSNAAAGMLAMVRQLLDTPDRTDELAKTGVPLLVAYGKDDYVWLPAEQSATAARLGARDEVIRGAGHSPAVQEPLATASLLDGFWRASASPE